MFSFWFDSDQPPANAVHSLALFKPGCPAGQPVLFPAGALFADDFECESTAAWTVVAFWPHVPSRLTRFALEGAPMTQVLRRRPRLASPLLATRSPPLLPADVHAQGQPDVDRRRPL